MAVCYKAWSYATNNLGKSKRGKKDSPVPRRGAGQGRQTPFGPASHLCLAGRGVCLGRPQGPRPEPRVPRGVLELAEGRALQPHRRGDTEKRLREGRRRGGALAR